MKFIIALAALAAALTGWTACGQGSLNFVGLNEVQFNANGNSFQLNPVAGSSTTPQFTFTGTDEGLNGWITGAPWAVNMAGLTTAAGGNGNLNLTFQFSGINPTLGDLFAGNAGTTSTSFSGAISTVASVPEPATAALFYLC